MLRLPEIQPPSLSERNSWFQNGDENQFAGVSHVRAQNSEGTFESVVASAGLTTVPHSLLLPSQTSTEPNSRAAVSLWNRFFQLQDEENEEKVEHLATVMDEHKNRLEIDDAELVQARKDFVKEGIFALTGRYRRPRIERTAEESAHLAPAAPVAPQPAYVTLPQ